MTATQGESGRQPTQIMAMAARGENRNGQIGIIVTLANAPSTRGEDGWLHSRLIRHVMAALDIGFIGTSSDGSLHMDISPEHFEQGVRIIRKTVADFNGTCDAVLLAEHTEEVERREAEERAKLDRLVLYQETIDRVMSE